jgi:molybdate transport system substrate-binding protein
MKLTVLSAGAAQPVVLALAPEFEREFAVVLDCTFGAVGALMEKIAAGAIADVVVLSRPLIDELAACGRVRPDHRADLGHVRTGLAVPSITSPLPDVTTRAALLSALREADEIYFPDSQRATAGIHFMKVVATLGLTEELQARLRPFPNGATAMRELALARGGRAIGCTQVTEIIATPGVKLVATLPLEFELVTVYSAAVGAAAGNLSVARRLVQRLTGSSSRALRAGAGFEPD